MEFELKIMATPGQLAALAYVVNLRIVKERRFWAFDVNSAQYKDISQIPVDAGLVELWFSTHTRDRGWIIAQSTPGGALVHVIADDEKWPALQPLWDALYQEIERQGWLTKAKKQRKPGVPKWLPIREDTLDKWRRAWEAIERRLELIHRGHDPSIYDEAEMTRADWADYLDDRIGWRPSAKTIGRIIKAGKAGLLDK